MDPMRDALVWLLGAIAVVNFLAASAVYLRGSRDKGTIATLERSNAALEQNNQILGERVTLLEASDQANGEKIAGQAHTIEVLTNTVNSSALITELKGDVLTALGEHHEAALEGISQLHADLDTLPTRLRDVLREQ